MGCQGCMNESNPTNCCYETLIVYVCCHSNAPDLGTATGLTGAPFLLPAASHRTSLNLFTIWIKLYYPFLSLN